VRLPQRRPLFKSILIKRLLDFSQNNIVLSGSIHPLTDMGRDSIKIRLAVASCALAAAVLATAWAIAGAHGLLYLIVLAAALLCGLPWGFALLGSRHAAGWLAGALFGYRGAGFIWWSMAIAGGASMPWWIAAWAASTGASWGLSRRWRQGPPPVTLARWTRANTLALVLTRSPPHSMTRCPGFRRTHRPTP
jgi:hypothetical protein